ncbi:EGF-like domain protein [Cooperia oncophora]
MSGCSLEAFLSCGSRLEDATVARWEKVDGDLPTHAETNRGVLRLPSLSRDDEGLYQCTAVENDTVTQSVIELHVDDFVPTFFGQESLVFPSLTDEQLRNLDVVLAVNPTGEDGVIFETARRPSLAGEDPAAIARPPNVEHRARIHHGVVVYEYDVGYGTAVLQLNSGPPTERPHHPTRFQQGSNGPVYIGAHIEPTDPEMVHQGFKGVISSMTVSGEPVDFGGVTRSPHMVSHDSCRHALCLHGSRCRNANNPKGYECVCPIEYAGEHCERRSAFCKNEDCNSGICEEAGDTWYCVCPMNATGLRCEVPVESMTSGVGFKAESSFMAMPSPKDLDHFQVSMNLKPEDVDHDRMLLYVAADYDPESKKHLSVSVTDGSIVYSYSDGEDSLLLLTTRDLQSRNMIMNRSEVKASFNICSEDGMKETARTGR